VERSSEHPLADAILRGAKERGVPISEANDFQYLTGKGIVGTVNGRKVALGNAALMEELGASLNGIVKTAEGLRQEGRTVMLVAIDGKPAGLVGVSDPIKKSTPEALNSLKETGIKVVMITGDNKVTAEAVAKKLGIDQVYADVLPQDKVAIVKSLQSERHIVAMAGDGVNDAPALAQANVGIAMGTGTDVAMQSADITLVKGDLRGIVRAIRLSKAVMMNIRQNLFFAFIYNTAGVPIAAGILYPFTGMLLSPVIAAAAMSFSSVSVIGNSLRLRSTQL
jgi:Cu+-exporting ATPase